MPTYLSVLKIPPQPLPNSLLGQGPGPHRPSSTPSDFDAGWCTLSFLSRPTVRTCTARVDLCSFLCCASATLPEPRTCRDKCCRLQRWIMASSCYTICEPTILEKVGGWLTRCRRCAGGRIPLYEGYIVDHPGLGRKNLIWGGRTRKICCWNFKPGRIRVISSLSHSYARIEVIIGGEQLWIRTANINFMMSEVISFECSEIRIMVHYINGYMDKKRIHACERSRQSTLFRIFTLPH